MKTSIFFALFTQNQIKIWQFCKKMSDFIQLQVKIIKNVQIRQYLVQKSVFKNKGYYPYFFSSELKKSDFLKYIIR